LAVPRSIARSLENNENKDRRLNATPYSDTQDCGLPIADCGFCDCRLRIEIADCGLRLPIAD
jgi:hypothetical protein